jgi:3-isopropylmalate/(R)-2-methylmalate dehydratase large subunit
MSHAHSTYAKIIAAHSVHRSDDGVVIVYADRHIVHPETSAQAFDGLRLAHRDVRRPEATLSPHADAPAGDPIRAKLLDTLDANAHEYHLGRFETGEMEEGIVQPGMVVCGHRSDIARFGGIGAVCFFTDAGACEHLLATQTLRLTLPPVMRVTLESAAAALSAENILALLVTQAGLPALRGHVLELDGGGIAAMDVDARLRLCAVLSGVATSGTLIAPDEKTIEWLKGRNHAPSGRDWPFACDYWETLGADKDASYDAEVVLALPQERSA